MIATCPCCGTDLQALQDYSLGPLTVERGVIIKWHGTPVRLTESQRLVLLALTRADGAAVRRNILAEAADYEGELHHNIVSVWINRINAAFRKVDPAFNMIENVWGTGLRWRTGEDQLLAA